MSARIFDLQLSRHQFGDAGQLRIVKPIPEVNASRFQDCLCPPIRIALPGSSSAVLSMELPGAPLPLFEHRFEGHRRSRVGASAGISALSRTRTLFANFRNACLIRRTWRLQVPSTRILTDRTPHSANVRCEDYINREVRNFWTLAWLQKRTAA